MKKWTWMSLMLFGCDLGVQSAGNNDQPVASIQDAIPYRDLATHPGCSTAGLSYPAASIPGYRCAAKEYAFPAGVTEDTTKPIVLLVHGNSDTPSEWEKYPADSSTPMLSERLLAQGFRVLAVDYRIDLNDDPQSNNDTENAARNVDHGWAVPIVQHFFESAMTAYPNRQFDIVGFSLGTTVVRDALRRMHIKGQPSPWPQLHDVILAAGANHGVSTFAALCGHNPTMRGKVTCQMGPRDNWTPTDWDKPLNGPNGAFETPCSDGMTAFGKMDACGGNTVRYTTIVMRDISDGSYQDEFVSESSAHLNGADNHLIGLNDTDQTGYFFNGLLKNHYGSCRSEAALEIMMDAVSR